MEYAINGLLDIALKYKDKERNLDNALKYAMLASTLSYSPRADVCCTIGEIYLEKGNELWASFWYEKALNNFNVGIDEELPESEYSTIIPMLKLCFIEHKMGNIARAKEYNDAVLIIQPDNEIALNNKKELENLVTKES